MTDKLKSLWRFFFGDSARAFGSMSLIVLALLAISPAKNYFSQWRHYQKQYLHLIRGRADAVTLERHFQGGIQQIWMPEQQVTDRSSTRGGNSSPAPAARTATPSSGLTELTSCRTTIRPR